MTAAEVNIRMSELLTFKVAMPWALGIRMWLAARIIWVGVWVSGFGCTIEVVERK
jgi:hypothetical protein